MIKVQQEGCPVQFITDNEGILQSAKFGFFKGDTGLITGSKINLSLNGGLGWTPEALRYVADTLEEARANGGKLVMEVK